MPTLLLATSNPGKVRELRELLAPARWRLVCYPPVNSGEAKPTAEGLTAMLNIAVELMVRRAV